MYTLKITYKKYNLGIIIVLLNIGNGVITRINL